ncbi:hypothetical protein PSEUBRA_002442 [Kalmanozyma brasiliensis GHG001]|uniref:uncharacterized protein n=1 Tax=Kalmanozyma brasiliensis (strain GHG001) TaxID=1365824 RepID=UPI001CE90F7C|nr:uncharacterized protein PSEUBRA_002442 [Kalmanozyma brasiliensis GHG001]KAF6767085.1 hypothetical protein PSEUBRA_002442 [Kalmanozyma brasiliensis GHG001]
MRRSARHRPSKLALTLSLFFLSTLAASADTSSSTTNRRTWRPDTELPGAKFVLGDGKNEGTKVKGYQGEWPLWSAERAKEADQKANEAAQKAKEAAPGPKSTDTSPASSSSASSDGHKSPAAEQTTHVCAPIGECGPCPQDVIHLPYCRPYNNRRRVACSPVSDLNDPKAIQAALDAASTASTTDVAVEPKVLLGHEACGKSARQEARDYFEMIAVIASLAIFSIWAFIQRQKLLFNRQSQQLQSRVTGRRESGPPPSRVGMEFGASSKAARKKRAVRLAPSSLAR